ncbi:hypothetical protein B0G84_6555 [Paraburkholderia sp. BL8N3]|jgi:hypothetical protein|nr:hypothetical protein [Paraburkholderia sp. BL8N3]TCK34597.1 hypothetical protein B0G84_6555 [Paraburkholderia sp. BL8N3]
MRSSKSGWICTVLGLSLAVSACVSAPPPPAAQKKPPEGVARVRAATEAAVVSSQSEISNTNPAAVPRRQTSVQCDTIGNMFICTDGEAICWWNARTGYGCN